MNNRQPAPAEALTRDFEAHRPRLRAFAYRMLGSIPEVDQALREVRTRLTRGDAGEVRDLAGWLTIALGRICLSVLESRRVRRRVTAAAHVPDPIVSPAGEADPESEALLGDWIGLDLMVALDTLEPAERLAFVLHDMFAVPLEEIAPLVLRDPAATRELADGARRRVLPARPEKTGLAQQREVVEAFLTAALTGDLQQLLAVLHPDVVLRADYGLSGAPVHLRGADRVARAVSAFGRVRYAARPVLVNGAPGAMAVTSEDKIQTVIGMTIRDGRVAGVNILGDPGRLTALGFRAAS